jgi:hypothetical protein
MWQGDAHGLDSLDGYSLWPRVRSDAIDWDDRGPTFPPFKRAALALGRSDANGLPSWAVLGGLFGPVPLSMPHIGARPENSSPPV